MGPNQISEPLAYPLYLILSSQQIAKTIIKNYHNRPNLPLPFPFSFYPLNAIM